MLQFLLPTASTEINRKISKGATWQQKRAWGNHKRCDGRRVSKIDYIGHVGSTHPRHIWSVSFVQISRQRSQGTGMQTTVSSVEANMHQSCNDRMLWSLYGTILPICFVVMGEILGIMGIWYAWEESESPDVSFSCCYLLQQPVGSSQWNLHG